MNTPALKVDAVLEDRVKNLRHTYMLPETHTRYLRYIQLYSMGKTKHEIAAMNGKSYRVICNSFTAMLSLYNANSMVHLVGILYRKHLLQ